ncbi:carbohydrate ABC transporter permease [Ureibacillus massiliensis]|uniref:carbohydrate ABC transporter permease n=1 Tax=Ureibacillus massiliensis TaxID=292806 RepID=UPI00055F1F7C|nr:sugar ABC transporter permease [Ureibacillus massiliensis]
MELSKKLKRTPRKKERKEPLILKVEPYTYLIPAALIMGLFTFWPFFQTIIRSLYLTDNLGRNALFVGFENYIELFTSSSFYNSVLITVLFVIIVVVVGVVLGFCTALLCQRTFPGIRFFSAAYALPMAVASSGIALVFLVMLNQSIGIVNQMLGTNINWLADPNYALLSIGVLTGWLNSGINFLYFSAGLAGIDRSLYESASIDGANRWNKFRFVTIPSLKPITFFVVVTNVINAFQGFAQIKILTSGGPGESTNVIVYDIYRNAFMNYRYGYASAESIVLFIIVMILTIIMFKMSKGGRINA